ncbi:MAG: alpha-L-rhamnosidase C-terminal domain-containing protein [Bacteroidota bacterium]
MDKYANTMTWTYLLGKVVLILILSIVIGIPVFAQNTSEKAVWISPMNEKHTDYGVFLFRNTFLLDQIPEVLPIHVTADNRYKLYVNGILIGAGPARGDLENWYYETYDIKSYLKQGKNSIAAEVVNFGEGRPMAQFTFRTAFWMNVESPEFAFLNTGSGNWKVKENEAYKAIPFGYMLHGKYYVCGPGDNLDFHKDPKDWILPSFNDTNWKNSYSIVTQQNDTSWHLIPRDIPFMDTKEEKIEKIARVQGLENKFWSEYPDKSITIPPSSRVTLLFDAEVLTIGFPQFKFSGGKDSEIKIIYAEALQDKNEIKGNRNEIEGKEIVGYYDIIRPDGDKETLFEPLWLRTFRYVQLEINTGEKALEWLGFTNRFYAYPLTFDATFQSSESIYEQFNTVGWRTLRLCAGETYFDCPYYEQLQYIGDTRVQALITLYLSKDDQLVRKAIKQFHRTILPEGLTHSRHPANKRQIIPGFSLYWVSMLYDYLMLRDDPAFIRQYIDEIDGVLRYFKPYIGEQNMLAHLSPGNTNDGSLPEYWYFTDWSKKFSRGIPHGVYDNKSSVITLHYANTLFQAAMIADYFNENAKAKQYKQLAQQLVKGTVDACFDDEKGLIAQTPDKKLFSQHANILAVLTNAFPIAQQKEIMTKILNDDSLIQCSMYFRFYLFEALKKLDMDSEIPRLFDFWHEALEMGLTTFPEKEGNTRSDCHAWNSSPLYFFLSAFAGVEPAEPGFKSVRISPQLINMEYVNASVPHPNGAIIVDLKKSRKGISGKVILPDNITGELIYGDEKERLGSGLNKIDLNN